MIFLKYFPVAPSIRTEPSGPTVTVLEGAELSLSCSTVAGSPPPVLRWGRCGGGEVLAESPHLRLTSLARSQAGCYQCLADNGFSQEPVTRDLTVIVQYPPSLSLERSEDSVEMMRITCSVVSRPAARVVISRETLSGEREELFSSETEEESQVSVGHNNEETLYSLLLTNLGPGQFGSYSCSAESPLGRAHQTTDIAGWPRLSSVKISSEPAQSSCYRVAVQLYSQYSVQNVNLLLRDSGGGRLGEFNIPPSYNNFLSHRLCNLTFTTNYSVDIRASNSYGESPPVQYNFTTEDQNIFNLPWSGALRSVSDKMTGDVRCVLIILIFSLQPASMITLVLQLLLMIRTF